MSKLSKFQPGKVLNGNGGEHLHSTTPIFAKGHTDAQIHIMEGAQLAHPETLRGEQVTCDADRDAIIAQAKHLATLTPGELAAYRMELDAATANDPHLASDREALALFNSMLATGAIA